MFFNRTYRYSYNINKHCSKNNNPSFLQYIPTISSDFACSQELYKTFHFWSKDSTSFVANSCYLGILVIILQNLLDISEIHCSGCIKLWLKPRFEKMIHFEEILNVKAILIMYI